MKTTFKWEKSNNQIFKDIGFNSVSNIAIAEMCARYMNPFVPMQTGVLSQTYETGVDLLGGYVRYTAPYAHYQFNGDGFDFSKEQHPLATSHWDKATVLASGVQLVSEANAIRKRFTR